MWHSNGVSAPLLTRRGQLLGVQQPRGSGRPRLVVLDAQTGKSRGNLPPLSSEVVWGVLGSSAGNMRGLSAGDRDFVEWSVHHLPITQGDAPVASGAALVDLDARSL